MIKRGLLIAYLLAGLLRSALASNEEFTLKTKLRNNYDITVRPVINFSSAVQVNVDLALNQIIDLNERSQSLLIALWMRLSWRDENLNWDPKQFGGLTVARLSQSDLWVPDVVPYKDIREEERDIGKFYAKVKYDGSVNFNYPLLLKTSCKLDVTYFPFDIQECKIVFGSWSYDGTQVNISSIQMKGDLSNYIKHGEWDLNGMPAERHDLYYGCCIEPFPDVTFYIKLSRRSLYYIFNLILPCVFAVGVTVLGFYLPAESGEKVSLGVTVLLTLTVFLLLVAESTPPQSEVVPLISLYFGVIIVLVATSTVLTVIIVHIHHKGSSGMRVPSCLRRATIILAKALFVRANVSGIRVYDDSDEKVVIKESSCESVNGMENGNVQTLRLSKLPEFSSSTPTQEQNLEQKQEQSSIKEIVRILQTFERKRKAMDEDELRNYEWTLVAKVFDKLFLFVFALISIVITLALLVRRP